MPGRSRRSRANRLRPGGTLAPYLFLLPNLVAVSLFTIWPALLGFRESVYRDVQGQTSHFSGFANYRELLTASEFWQALLHTAEFVVGFVTGTMVLATFVALMLYSQGRGKAVFRTSIYLPVLISPVVIGILWNWMLQPTSGALDAILSRLGLGQPGWLVDPHLAMMSVILVELWATLGFFALILLGGLTAIDPTLLEAAKIDGANYWVQTRRVTLPLLRPSLLVVGILSTIMGFQAFDFLYTLTGGGPLGATTLIVQYIYDHAFIPPINFGLATSGSVVLFVILLVLTLANLAVSRRNQAS